MKKILLLILLLAVAVLSVSCGENNKTQNPGGTSPDNYSGGDDPVPEGKMEDFVRFRLGEFGTTMGESVIEGWRTEQGIHLECYFSIDEWDDETEELTEKKIMSRAIDCDEAVYQQVLNIMDENYVYSWDGFEGYDPEVLDGSSMRFEAVLENGETIEAHGSNDFPRGYGNFQKTIRNLITDVPITETQFEGYGYTLTLPESWIGIVTATFSEEMVTFHVDNIRDGGIVLFLILDQWSYGYSSETYSECMDIGEITDPDGNVAYMTLRTHSPLAGYSSSISEEAAKLWDTFEADKQAIADSIEPLEGWTLERIEK